MKKVKFLLCMVAGVLFLFSFKTYAVHAMEVPVVLDMRMENGVILVDADVIETYYRYIDGKVQYRRWNATRGYWVDPDWIDL